VKTKKKAMLKIYKYISQDNNDTLSLWYKYYTSIKFFRLYKGRLILVSKHRRFHYGNELCFKR
jgi:hypothetical protein